MDRNNNYLGTEGVELMSPSSRRAWIEILVVVDETRNTVVALLAEGVDRNCRVISHGCLLLESPSSRRAWIEITFSTLSTGFPQVALLAEGVDRNHVSFESYRA